MTSKNLFFKLIKQDFQKRIWCPAIVFLTYFLTLEVNMLRMFGKLEEDISRYYCKDIQEYVEKCFFGTDIKLAAVTACGLAFVCALSGFSYLHSRVQIDAYNSLPVNRVQTFCARYLSGALQFFLPFVIHIAVCMGIAAAKAAFSFAAFINALQMAGVVTLVFLLCYSVFIMASCLTGNVIINVLGCGVLFFYSAAVSLLLSGLFGIFFSTYIVVGHHVSGMYFEDFFGFSPISMLVQLFQQGGNGTFQYHMFFKFNADRLWVTAAAAAVYTVIAFVLYRKRASEAAGRPIAFRWAEPVIKTMLVIPISFFCGTFFRSIASSESSNAWYLFGVLLGYVISALLLEMIFRLDIKGAFSHKGQLVFNAACVAVIVMIFQYDALGYDSYVPAETELSSCSVSIENLMSVSPTVREGKHYYYYTDATDYRMENVKMQGNPSVMALAKKAAAEKLEYGSDSAQKCRDIVFGYHLKNGKSVYRTYVIDITDEETLKLLADIFNDSNYKVGTSPMLSGGWKKEYKKLYCVGNFNSAVLDMTPEFQSALLETYQEEYLQLDFSTVLDTYPVGCMEAVTAEESDASLGVSYIRYGNNGSLIYPQFTKTIALLKENGFDVYEPADMEEFDYIGITYKTETVVYEGGYSYTSHGYADVGRIYNKEQQEQLLDCLLNASYGWQTKAYAELEDENFEASVHTKSNDSSLQRSFWFKKGRIPDFVYALEGYQKTIAAGDTQENPEETVNE